MQFAKTLNHCKKINTLLEKRQKNEIQWRIQLISTAVFPPLAMGWLSYTLLSDQSNIASISILYRALSFFVFFIILTETINVLQKTNYKNLFLKDQFYLFPLSYNQIFSLRLFLFLNSYRFLLYFAPMLVLIIWFARDLNVKMIFGVLIFFTISYIIFSSFFFFLLNFLVKTTKSVGKLNISIIISYVPILLVASVFIPEISNSISSIPVLSFFRDGLIYCFTGKATAVIINSLLLLACEGAVFFVIYINYIIRNVVKK